MYAKLRSTLSRIGSTDEIVMQSIVHEEFAQGPYVATTGQLHHSIFVSSGEVAL